MAAHLRHHAEYASRAASCPIRLSPLLTPVRGTDTIPAGPLIAPAFRFQFAIYFLGAPSKSPREVLEERLAEKVGSPTLVKSVPDSPSCAVVMATLNKSVQTDCRPPDLDMIQRFGGGITRGQAESLQRSKLAFVLDYAHPSPLATRALRAAHPCRFGPSGTGFGP